MATPLFFINTAINAVLKGGTLKTLPNLTAMVIRQGGHHLKIDSAKKLLQKTDLKKIGKEALLNQITQGQYKTAKDFVKNVQDIREIENIGLFNAIMERHITQAQQKIQSLQKIFNGQFKVDQSIINNVLEQLKNDFNFINPVEEYLEKLYKFKNPDERHPPGPPPPQNGTMIEGIFFGGMYWSQSEVNQIRNFIKFFRKQNVSDKEIKERILEKYATRGKN